MIQVMHWLASWVVLSVVLAQLESIKITATAGLRLIARALGWALLGLDAVSTIIKPFWPQYTTGGCELGMIGLAVLAISYRWQGATKHVRER